MSTRILLVEDDPYDVERVRRAFDEHRITNHIDVVGDGAAALDYLTPDGQVAALPQLILLDLGLPGMNGLDVLRHVRSQPRTQRIPVVLLSGSRSESDVTLGYELGANSYIVKPVAFENFAEAIRTVGLYWTLFNEPPSD